MTKPVPDDVEQTEAPEKTRAMEKSGVEMPISLPVKDLQGQHVLVAEDSLLYQRLTAGLLQRRGVHVTLVNNGQEAVVAARDFHFDLILMDIEMPVLDGCGATRQIREQEAKLGQHVPIIAVTSLDDRARFLSAGMDAYIAKPLSLAALDEALRELAADTVPC